MRIKELLIERQMSDKKSAPMSFSKHYPTMPSSDAYQAYRFGVAMANHKLRYSEGPSAQHAIVVAYTPEEEEIIVGAELQTGHRGKLLADKTSHEVKSTGIVSPVATKKKNKWGV